MNPTLADLGRPRTFTPQKNGSQRFCAYCLQGYHAHKPVDCSGCGREFRVCLICPEAQTGLSHCADHRP
jgi:uncharacterized Zn-finger protein